MKNFILTLLCAIATFSIVCYAGTVYDDARQAGITQYNSGNYSAAAKHFIAIQNIAPVNNDLGSWITKCNNKMVKSRNARIKKIKSTTVPKPVQSKGSRIERYDSVGNFGSSNLALVRYNNKYGFINKDSIIVVPIQYDDVYAIITENAPESTYGDFIKGNDLKWDWTWDKGELMSICKDGKWGYINENGKECIPAIYDDVLDETVSIESPVVCVMQDGLYGFVDRTGVQVIPFEYDFIAGYNIDTQMALVVKNGKIGFIDASGNALSEFIYDALYEYENGQLSTYYGKIWFGGIMPLRKNNKWGLINQSALEVSPFEYDELIDITPVQLDLGIKFSALAVFRKNNEEIYWFNNKEYSTRAEADKAICFKRLDWDNKSILDLAEIYYYDDRNYEQSIYWATEGMKRNVAGSKVLLAKSHLDRGGQNNDIVEIAKAATLFMEAADEGDSEAQYQIGYICLQDWNLWGDGPNKQMAAKYLKMSARQGHDRAQSRLREMGISSY